MPRPFFARRAPLAKSAAPAGTAELDCTDGLRRDLTHQVDFQTSVHRLHIVLLRDDSRVIGIGTGCDPAGRVGVQGLIQGKITQSKGADMLAGVHGLILTGDVAAANQIHHVGGKHFGVQAQVVLLSQLDRQRVGQTGRCPAEWCRHRESCQR